MKSKNSLPAAILTGSTEKKIWVIDIDMGNGTTVKMEFTDKGQATTEYETNRQKGIYGGRWIKEISINEQVTGS
jgi:ATP-dependent Zn protease